MFGFTSARRPARSARPAIVRTAPAAFEPLESRQLMSVAGLTVLYTKDTLPTNVLTDTKIKGAITLSLTNSDVSNDKGTNTFVAYASPVPTLDTSTALKLGSLTKNLNLAPSKVAIVSVPVKSIIVPSAGTYYILVAATNAAGTLSTVAAPNLNVAAAFVSLQPVVGSPSPTALVAGKPVKVKVTITNAGNVSGTGPLTTGIYLSTDGASLGTFITSQKKGVTIKQQGKAVAFTYSFKIPQGTTPGMYFIGFTFNQGIAAQAIAYTPTELTIGS